MITREGYLSKWTNVMKGWQHRWVVLDDNAAILSYYVSRDKMRKGLRRGCIPLKRAVVGIDNEEETNFTVTAQLKIYHFQAQNITERDDWVSSIEDTIFRHVYGTKRHPRSLDSINPHSSIEDFNKKLSEADSYLQMVIEQTSAVSTRMNTLQKNTNRAMCSLLTTYANNFLDEVKHTIILMQIVKNTMDPTNVHACVIRADAEIHGTEANENRLESKNLIIAPQMTMKAAYSASDDENFFDARETMSEDSTPGSQETGSSPEDKAEKLVNHGQFVSSSSDHRVDIPSQLSESEDEICPHDIMAAIGKSYVSNTSKESKSSDNNQSVGPGQLEVLDADGSVNYDNMYENPEESETPIERSVVSHLISQVKVGMDLSKVVLPIFILEKRSLLEMYADFFAHSDEFVGISDQRDAKARMVQLVKWYLSSFHAARRSSIAKKPYNPVLGEVFLCSWDMGLESNVEGSQKDTGASMQLSFTAEQVSHHPPVTAFYAECPSKRISCLSTICTKSKFYGLSVGVINQGEAMINVIDHNEQYTLTFPNVYGRSILTKPWVELGGNVRIACDKTGYVANIEFLTKPFYGTKKHRVVGAILEPGASEPFVTLEGEWCGKIYARWSNGGAEIFSDVNETTIFKKNVRSVLDQEDFESRMVWKDVTAGLCLNDIGRATNAKIEIESRQRREAQARRENGEEWTPRFFRTSNGNWIFREPKLNND